jgi:hypothetical protein
MARSGQRVHIPPLDAKFVQDRNPDDHWLVERFNDNISLLNKVADNLPRNLPWRIRTVEQLKAEMDGLFDKERHLDAYRLAWQDMLDQVQAFGMLSVLRLIELVSSAVWAIRRNDPLCAAITARAALETSASYAWFQSKMRPGIEAAIGKLTEGILVDFGPLETELLKTLWASRLEDAETFYNPTNIVTIVDHITNKIPHQEDVGPCYRLLCEVAHPNMLGRSMFLSEENGRTIISRNRGPSTKLIEHACLLALSWAAGTLPRSLTPMQDACVRLMVDLKHRASSYGPSGKFELRRVPMASFTLADLKAQIDACPDGGAVGLPYDAYADLFPPGEPDENARAAAYNFAKANSCTIDNKPDANIVFFVKPKKAS